MGLFSNNKVATKEEVNRFKDICRYDIPANIKKREKLLTQIEYLDSILGPKSPQFDAIPSTSKPDISKTWTDVFDKQDVLRGRIELIDKMLLWPLEQIEKATVKTTVLDYDLIKEVYYVNFMDNKYDSVSEAIASAAKEYKFGETTIFKRMENILYNYKFNFEEYDKLKSDEIELSKIGALKHSQI